MYNLLMKLIKKYLEKFFVKRMGIKLLNNQAKIPTMGRVGDACFDVYSCEDRVLFPLEPAIINCGISCDIPSGYKIMINGRSGLASKGIFCHVGTVDENFRGNIGPILVNVGRTPYPIKTGDRVGQISLQRVIPINFIEVAKLSESNRGAAGFGSSGK